jgi:hypothetical protein
MNAWDPIWIGAFVGLGVLAVIDRLIAAVRQRHSKKPPVGKARQK